MLASFPLRCYVSENKEQRKRKNIYRELPQHPHSLCSLLLSNNFDNFIMLPCNIIQMHCSNAFGIEFRIHHWKHTTPAAEVTHFLAPMFKGRYDLLTLATVTPTYLVSCAAQCAHPVINH